jgi:hypothetical protein
MRVVGLRWVFLFFYLPYPSSVTLGYAAPESD